MKKDVLKRLQGLSKEQLTEVFEKLSLTELEIIRESFSDNTDDRDRDDDDASRGYVPEDPQIEVYGAATDTEERFLKGRQLVFYSVEETDTMEEFKLYQYIDDSEGLQVKHKDGGEIEPWQMIIGLAIDVDGESGNNQITLMYVLNKSGRKAKIEYERCNLKSILKDFLSDQGLTLFKDEDFDNDFGSDEEDEIKGAEVSSDIDTDGVQDIEDDDEEKMATVGSDKGMQTEAMDDFGNYVDYIYIPQVNDLFSVKYRGKVPDVQNIKRKLNIMKERMTDDFEEYYKKALDEFDIKKVNGIRGFGACVPYIKYRTLSRLISDICDELSGSRGYLKSNDFEIEIESSSVDLGASSNAIETYRQKVKNSEEKMATVGSDKGINDAYDPSDPDSKFFVCALQSDGWQIYCKNPELYEQRHMIRDIFKQYFKKNFRDYYDEGISVGSAGRAIQFAGSKLIQDFADEYPECHTSDFVVAQKQRTVNVGECGANEGVKQYANDKPYYTYNLGMGVIFYKGNLTPEQEEMFEEAFESNAAHESYNKYMEELSGTESEIAVQVCEKVVGNFVSEHPEFKPEDFFIQEENGPITKHNKRMAAVSEANEDEGESEECVFETDYYTIVCTCQVGEKDEEDLAQAFESEEAIEKFKQLLKDKESEQDACQQMIEDFVEENPKYDAEDFYVEEYLPKDTVDPNVFMVGNDVAITYKPDDLTEGQQEVCSEYFESEDTYEKYEKEKKSENAEFAAQSLINDFCDKNIGFEPDDFEFEILEEEKAEQKEIEEAAEGVKFPEFSIGNYCKIFYTGGKLTDNQFEAIDEFFESGETYMSFKQLGKDEEAARTLISDLCEKYHEFNVQDFDVKGKK